MMTHPSQTPVVVLTVGHSTRTLQNFLHLLAAYEVARLVDVRTIPRSRHNPQFNKDGLQAALHSAGIEYQHAAGLGGLRHARANSPNQAWHNLSFRGYADYMQTPEFRRHLQALMRLARNERVALMCAEAVPWRCHRSLIADALVARGFQVRHIMSATQCPKHVLTPWAVVKGQAVSYPLAAEGPLAAPAGIRAAQRSRRRAAPPRRARSFKVGDHVEWNSEAGWVRGTIKKCLVAPITFKGYTVRASKDEPRYLIKSDKTDHLAMHKGTALKKIRTRPR